MVRFKITNAMVDAAYEEGRERFKEVIREMLTAAAGVV